METVRLSIDSLPHMMVACMSECFLALWGWSKGRYFISVIFIIIVIIIIIIIYCIVLLLLCIVYIVYFSFYVTIVVNKDEYSIQCVAMSSLMVLGIAVIQGGPKK